MADPASGRPPGPDIAALRRALGALASHLVDLESEAAVAVARGGGLTGTSAATWADADAGLAGAWDVYRNLDELLQRAEADPTRGWTYAALSTVALPGGGQAPPDQALAMAGGAVDAARSVIDRLLVAWDGYAGRVTAATTLATAAGDGDTARAADALAELLASDPLAVTEADVAAVEARATAARDRHAGAATAAARLDVDLEAARRRLAALSTDVAAAGGELAHAASRIAGLGRADPARDLDALAAWLERVEAAAASTGDDPTRTAATLADWSVAAQARRDELDAALGEAREAMRRRDEDRGLWTALRAKAGARRLDERPEVADALSVARDLLWQAPCDLPAAGTALARLSSLLTTPPPGAGPARPDDDADPAPGGARAPGAPVPGRPAAPGGAATTGGTPVSGGPPTPGAGHGRGPGDPTGGMP